MMNIKANLMPFSTSAQRIQNDTMFIASQRRSLAIKFKPIIDRKWNMMQNEKKETKNSIVWQTFKLNHGEVDTSTTTSQKLYVPFNKQGEVAWKVLLTLKQMSS